MKIIYLDQLPQHDFLMFEFLISLLIISLSFIISIPIYQTHLLRAKMAELISLTIGAKTNIAHYYSYHGHFPISDEQVNIVTSGTYLSDVTINNGTVLAKFGPENGLLSGLSLSLRPALAKHNSPKVIKWVCGYAQVPAHFMLQGKNQTTIPSEYLVSTCR